MDAGLSVELRYGFSALTTCSYGNVNGMRRKLLLVGLESSDGTSDYDPLDTLSIPRSRKNGCVSCDGSSDQVALFVYVSFIRGWSHKGD